MQAAHRMHLSDGQNFSMPRREERPLSTRIMCISPFCRGARKYDVYWVIELPVVLRVSRRMKTARSSFLGMIFSNPNEQIRSSGTLPERSALPFISHSNDGTRFRHREIGAGHSRPGSFY